MPSQPHLNIEIEPHAAPTIEASPLGQYWLSWDKPSIHIVLSHDEAQETISRLMVAQAEMATPSPAR